MIRPFNSVRARLTAWNVGVVALVLVLSAFVLRALLEHNLNTAIERDLARQGRWMQSAFAKTGPMWDLPRVEFEERKEVHTDIHEEVGSHSEAGADMAPPKEIKWKIRKEGSSSQSTWELQAPPPSQPPQPDQKLNPPSPPSPTQPADPPNPPKPAKLPKNTWSMVIDTSQADTRPRVLDMQGVDPRPEGPVGPWDAAAFREAAQDKEVFSTIFADGRVLRVYSAPARFEDVIHGVIQVVEPLSATERALAQLNRTLWVLVPVALLAAALGGAFLSGRALKPVGEVASAAEAVQAENLSQRLPVRGADEFAQLTSVLNRMLDRLEAAFDRQRRFTGDASHELRTPLAVIKATSSLATADQWEAEACHRAMRSIEGAADRAERIVEDLLLLAKADADTLLREPRPVSLEKVLIAAVEEARVAGAGKGAPIMLEAAEIAGVTLYGDFDQLSRVFINLLTNALRHTPADGRIIVAAERQPGQLLVQVADNGEGIPHEHLSHLGERFYRVDSARGRTRGGSGLGLAICKAIVQAHHGTMAIDSSVGVGTVVTIALPLKA